MWGNYIGNIIMTFLISMVPVIELRGAIPIGVANGLSIPVSMLASVIGNLLPVPFIILFVRSVFAWLRKLSVKLDGLVTKLENRAADKADMVHKYELLGLILLVAVPLPGTGAWTGALVAAMMDIRLKRAFPAIFIGVIIAGIIVSYITYGATKII